MEKNLYDMIIIGGGPAGYTAALYGKRAGLKCLILEKYMPGGQMAEAHNIENYPGFEDGIDGFSLAEKMMKQAVRFGAESKYKEVLSVDLSENPKVVKTKDETFFGKTIVVATGANPRELGIENEKALVGKGVSYCATCDGMFYKDKVVSVIGGGDTAAVDALLLSRVAKKVFLVHRRDSLRATRIYQDSLMNAKNIEIRWNSVVSGLLFEDKLKGIRLKDVKTNAEEILDCEGMFVSIGRKPATEFLEGQMKLSESGYIIADETTKTSIEGVFAIGDVREKEVRQVVTAVSDGAVACHMVEEYLSDK